MRYRSMMAVAMLLLPLPLPAQRCDGLLRFVLLDPAGDTVRFTPRAAVDSIPSFTSIDGRYLLSAAGITQRTGRSAVLTMSAYADAPYVGLRYGCAGNCDLTIVRSATAHESADTMLLHLENLADAHFGALLRFRPGRFDVPIRDTTRYDDARNQEGGGFHYRSLGEQFPGRLFGGYDVTGRVGLSVEGTSRKVRRLRLGIRNASEQYVEQASVGVRMLRTGETLQAVYAGDGAYVVDVASSEAMEITVRHPDYQAQVFQLGKDDRQEVLQVRLGREGDAYEYRRDRMFAYKPYPNLLAVSIRGPYGDSLRPVFDSLGIHPVDAAAPGVIIVRKQMPFDRMNSYEIAALRRNPLIRWVAPIRTWTNDRFVGFSSFIIVRFRSDISTATRDSILHEDGIMSSRARSSSHEEYELELEPQIGEGIVDVVRDLARHPAIVEAYIDYVVAP